MLQEMSKMLKTQELENARQTAVIDQQGEVISRLEEAMISCDRKCKPEVLEWKPEVLKIVQILLLEFFL